MPDPSDKQSKVLALVFTDLADSTALKTQRGDAAIETLVARHANHIRKLAADCGGRVIDWAGDGCFLTFNTSSSAVVFALRLQLAHAEEPDLPGVRVGVHMGEVTEQTGEHGASKIAGLAVDIASRICGLAQPGQILMSSAVYDSARQRVGVESFGKPILWQAHGTYAIKGFDKDIEISEAGVEGFAPLTMPKAGDKARLVRRAKQPSSNAALRFGDRNHSRIAPIWGVVILALLGTAALVYSILAKAGSREDATRNTPASANTPIRSLAVLPLDNLSNDPDQEYFADGMTEAITSELSKIRALKVVSRTSVMKYKKTKKSMQEVAAELNVDGLIEGSVQRDGDDVKITVQLIRGSSNVHFWSDSYPGKMTNILQLQSDVALAIADALRAELTGDERARIATSREVIPAAHDAFVLGNHYRDQPSGENLRTAIRYLREAVRIDPTFAEAWAQLGRTYVHLRSWGMASPEESIPEARDAYLKAIELDGTLAMAHAGLANISMSYDWEWLKADERFQHALELDPNDAWTHANYARYLAVVGRVQEAVAQSTLALDRDTQDPWVTAISQCVYIDTGQAGPLRESMEQLLVQYPDFPPALDVLQWAYVQLRLYSEAEATASHVIELTPGDNTSRLGLAWVLALTGQTARSTAILDEVMATEKEMDLTYLAWPLLLLGRQDEAFEAFEKSLAARHGGMEWLRVMPYDPIHRNIPEVIRFRTDPRYRALIEKMKFPPLPKEHPGYAEEQAWLAQNPAQTTP